MTRSHPSRGCSATYTRVALAALAWAAATQAWALGSQRFNLLCHGQEAYVSPGARQPPRTVTQLYRIDLTQGLWCSARCERTRRVEREDDLRIVLSSAESGGLSDSVVYDKLGKRVDYATGQGFGADFIGFKGRVTCETKPFSDLTRSISLPR